MKNNLWILGAFFGATAIILGAFGAHALKEVLTPEQLTSFETGVRYQMYHAIVLLVVSRLGDLSDAKLKAIGWLMGLGVLFFSGSIYLLSTGLGESVKNIIGPITPVGGTLLIIGWIVLLMAKIRKKS